MGLFSTLASATSTGSNKDGESATSSEPASSATIATVVQLYTNEQIILMEETPVVTGYSSLTYQAVQVGASSLDAELKNKHSNPDLGIWNCRVLAKASKENSDPLADNLLAKLKVPSSVFCVTVDLSDETKVEPNLSTLQAALVRHLIEKEQPLSQSSEDDSKVKTTSLYDLQTVQFGLASDEKAAEQSIEESAKEIKVGLMICAVVSSKDDKSIDESSESAYKKKQARALIVYHLRKFAMAINAALCFVERPQEQGDSSSSSKPKEEEAKESGAETATNNDVQLSVSYDKLSQLWRDMANGIPVWEQEQPTEQTENKAVAPTALYGPSKQQEDLIETVLLRNANYPGHWDASKDSLWTALPSSEADGSGAATKGASGAGDDGWLTQLRDSIASALPAAVETPQKAETPAKDAKPAEKDEAVTDFFASLLKNP